MFSVLMFCPSVCENSLYFDVRAELDNRVTRLRACLHGVGDPGLVGLVSFAFTLWGTQNKRNLPHETGVPHSM